MLVKHAFDQTELDERIERSYNRFFARKQSTL